MFHLLAFFFIFILVILFIGLSIVGSILRAIFGLGKQRKASGTFYNNSNPYQTDEEAYSSTYRSASTNGKYSSPYSEKKEEKHKKIFSKDEGEYVDYEEIKE